MHNEYPYAHVRYAQEIGTDNQPIRQHNVMNQ